jgi:cytochrome b
MLNAWDWRIRLFHWSLVAVVVLDQFVLDFGGAWHNRLGYAACVFIALRALGGATPQWRSRPRWASGIIVAMLAGFFLLALTGWMMSWDRFFGEDFMEDIHESIGWALVALAVAHIAWVFRESAKRRRNLAWLMIVGVGRAKGIKSN